MPSETEISKEHDCFLRKISKSKEYAYASSEINMVIYLCKNGLLVQYSGSSGQSYCKLTEYGKAFIYSRKIEKRMRFIPIIISIVALVASLAAIVLSPFFTAYFTALYGL